MATVVGPAPGADREAVGDVAGEAGEAGDRGPASRFPTLAAVVGGAFALWGLVIGVAPLGDNSFLTHLATGRLLLDQGIPTADPYSWTAPGSPWVVQSWLASAVYGLADQVGGGTALRLVVGLSTAVLAALLWRLSRPASLIARVAIVAVALGVGTEAWSERPLLFGLVFLALLLVAADGGLDPRWAVPVLWLWVNMHGSFPLGLVALGLLGLGRHLDGRPSTVEGRVLGWALVGTLLGAVSPLGPRLLWFPVQLLSRQETLHNIVEWKAPTFDTLGQRLFLLQLVAAVVLLVRRPSYRVALPLAVFAAAALLGLRNIPVASLVLVPGMAVCAAGLGTIDGARRSLGTALAAAGLAALAVLVLVSAAGQENFELEGYPVEAVRWLDDEGLVGTEVRLVSRDFVGNYLEALEGEDVRVFMDDRYDMYPPAVAEDYIDLVKGLDPGAVLARYDAEVVLWDRETPFAAWLEEADEWGVVYRDEDWLVACPRSGPGQEGRCPAPAAAP
ncbi:MAG: hypothetical protein H6518_07230 [Microthrixaceae bacterium]|nr:hypothetical protein [Microthrixaceae bacterium]